MTWTLNLGDCLDPVSGLASLTDKSVDHVITDPPYGAEAHEKGKRQNSTWDGIARAVDEEFSFAAITEAQRDALGNQFGRVCRGRVVVFCQVEDVDAWRKSLMSGGLKYLRTIPWVKPDAMPSLHGRWPGQAFEAIVLAQAKGADKCPIGGKARYYEHTRRGERPGERRPHPTVKPLDLMINILDDFTNEGDSVLDPFSGSGSTGVACGRLGRHFIGWELSPEYHAIATRRLNGERAILNDAQPELFGGVA